MKFRCHFVKIASTPAVGDRIWRPVKNGSVRNVEFTASENGDLRIARSRKMAGVSGWCADDRGGLGVITFVQGHIPHDWTFLEVYDVSKTVIFAAAVSGPTEELFRAHGVDPMEKPWTFPQRIPPFLRIDGFPPSRTEKALRLLAEHPHGGQIPAWTAPIFETLGLKAP